MIYRFSQKVPQELQDRIKRLWRFVQTQSAPKLCLKVFFYNDVLKRYELEERWNELEKMNGHWRDKNLSKEQYVNTSVYRWATRANGHYTNINVHGFYKKDWELYQKFNTLSIITLKIGRETQDKNIIRLMAHEWRHYLQYKDGRPPKYSRKESDAEKYAGKIVKKFLSK